MPNKGLPGSIKIRGPAQLTGFGGEFLEPWTAVGTITGTRCRTSGTVYDDDICDPNMEPWENVSQLKDSSATDLRDMASIRFVEVSPDVGLQ